QQAPGDHDAGNPEPCPEPLERQIARHLKEEVAEKEDPGAPAEHRRGEAEIAVHLQRGKTDIDPIEVAEEVAERDEGNDAAAYLVDDLRLHKVPPSHLVRWQVRRPHD